MLRVVNHGTEGANAPPADVYGDPGPRAVVLLHGAVVNRKMWTRIAEEVEPVWPLLAPDLPGHGDLDRLPFRMDLAVDGVRALLDEHGVEEAVLVGESLGGYVALATARERPVGLSGVVLSGASLNPAGPVGALLRAYGALTGTLSRWMDDARLESWARSALERSFPDAPVESMSALGLSVGARPESLRELAGRDLFARLERWTWPVLIVNGRRDLPNRLGGRWAARRIPDVETRVIHGAGHGVALARPEAFSETLIRFLGRCGGSR